MVPKRHLGFTLFAIALIIVIVFTGCQSAEHSNDNKDNDNIQVTPERLRILTASSGGVFHVYGTALSQILETVGIYSQVETSPGSTDNTPLIDQDPITIGLSSNVDAYEGANGIEWSEGEKRENIRGLFPIYPSPIVFVMESADKELLDITELNNKTIGLGPAGGAFNIHSKRIFEIFDIKPKNLVNYAYGDQVTAMQDGLIDVFGSNLGQPASQIIQLEQNLKLGFVKLNDDQYEEFKGSYPYYSDYIMNPEHYESLSQEFKSLTTFTCFIAHKDLSDDVVYKIIKALFDNHEDLVSAVKAAEHTTFDNVKFEHFGIPLHAGAVKYYKEMGLELDDSLIPPEFND